MSSFSILPDVLLIVVLCEWCELKSLVKLDSAVCSSELRNEFLSLVSCNEFIITQPISDKVIGQVEWIYRRSVSVTKLILNDIPVCLINCSDCKVKSKVQFLSYDETETSNVQYTAETVASFLSSFPVLTCLHLSNVEVASLKLIANTNVWRNLNELSIYYGFHAENNASFTQLLRRIGSSCNRLTSFELVFDSSDYLCDSELIALIRNDVLLGDIYCTNCASILTTIAIFNPQMRKVHIGLRQREPLDLSECVHFINHHKATEIDVFLNNFNFTAMSDKREVSIWGSNVVNVYQFMCGVKDVHSFTVSGFYDLLLSNLVSMHSTLAELNLFDCVFSLIDMVQLLRVCKCLRKLTLCSCGELSDADFLTIMLSNQNQIEQLALISSMLSLATVIRIINACPAITAINVRSALIPGRGDSVLRRNGIPSNRRIKMKVNEY